jgi:Trk K+ transport system NAD-binding subunit
VAINRAGTVFLCTPDTILRDNDLLYLAVLPASIERLRALLEI